MMKKRYGRTVLALLLCISTFFVHVTVYARGGEDTLPPDESAALSDSMHRIKTSMAAETEAAVSAETKTEGTEAEARAVPASDDTGSYTDNHGITYKYYLYDGDKLNIYEITGYEGEKKLMNIPMEISSYKVTQITACLSYGAELDSLTIPDTVTYVGEGAFSGVKIGALYYNAVEASTTENFSTAPFASAEIHELHIGENVTEIPDFMFSNAYLTQDEIDLKVSRIGRGAFYNGITVKNLVIGENVSYIGASAFSRCTIDRAAVYALKADDDFKGLSFTTDELPVCASVEIHTGSDFYRYFTDRIPADSVTPMCNTFETVYGEEYYDDESHSFITPYEEECVVCGYGTERKNFVAAFTVSFLDHDGSVIKIQHVKRGEAATAPENPSRPAEEWGTWEFKGWNGNYENVLKDETVQAIFEKKLYTYTVKFEDADGNVIEEQEVEHGHSVKLPEAPKKEPDEQYEYFFTGWDGDTENVTDDTVFRPVYEAKTRSYTVIFMSEGKILDKQSVKYGEAAVPPSDPKKEPDGEYSYTFTGWDGDYSYITSDVTIHAKFEKEKLPPGGSGEDGKDPDDDKPGTGSGDTKPGSGDTKPGNDDAKPEDGGKKPGDNTGSGDGGNKEPGGDTGADGSGRKPDYGTEPGTEEPGNGQAPDAGTTQNPPATETETGQTPKPQTPDTGKPDMETTQTETDNTEGTVGTDNAGDTETTLQDKEDAGDNFLWLFFAAFAVRFFIWLLLLLLLLLFYGEKIYGTVRECGESVNGLHITLERLDKKKGYEIKTVNTDKNGAFCFSGLPKNSYRLGFLGMAGQSAFSMDIHMGEKEKNIFTVPATCHDVETEKKGRKYVVAVEA